MYQEWILIAVRLDIWQQQQCLEQSASGDSYFDSCPQLPDHPIFLLIL
jgi:hypothetical protein